MLGIGKTGSLMSSIILKALKTRYLSEIAEAEANIEVYLKYPAGVAEHPDMVSTVDTQIERIAAAEDKLKALDRYLK